MSMTLNYTQKTLTHLGHEILGVRDTVITLGKKGQVIVTINCLDTEVLVEPAGEVSSSISIDVADPNFSKKLNTAVKKCMK